MHYWLITGFCFALDGSKVSLPTLVVYAESLDKALERARKENPAYSSGQIVEVLE